MSHKSSLLELCVKNKWSYPEYRVNKKGPDHIPRYTSKVLVNGTYYKGGQFSTTKAAEHDAGRKALEGLVNSPAAAATCEKPLAINAAAATCEQPLTLDAASTSPVSQKSLLQQLCQKYKRTLPKYNWKKGGPEHDPRFGAVVFVAGLTFYGPFGFMSIKSAEDEAARQALIHFTKDPESIRGATD